MIEVSGLKKYFPVKRGVLQRTVGWVKAVDDISFSIDRGETFGLVGESGSGKTTTGRLVLSLLKPDGGSVRFGGIETSRIKGNDLRDLRRRMQIIFQDPFSSLDPRMRIMDIVAEGLLVHGGIPRRELIRKCGEALEMVGLAAGYDLRYPHQLSGGERQRIGIARAMIMRPDFVVCDEPVSSLDVSIQAQILKLLKDLQKRLNLTYLFITHDLAIVSGFCDRAGVMLDGKIVETGDIRAVFERPRHPYTKRLLSCIPVPDPRAKRQTPRW